MRRLIVNADDFGLTQGVNRGIIDCCRAGAVSSATLMVTARAAAAAALAADSRHLGVGLHLNLTSGNPALDLGRIPSLVDNAGKLIGARKMIFRLIAGLARRSEIEAEIEAQINLCRALGVEPTHVDTHHHLHADPRLRANLSRACRRHGIVKARGYRMRASSFRTAGIRLAASVPVVRAPLLSPDRFSGMEVMGSKNMAAALRAELARPGDSLEFMCHPGYDDEELSSASSYSALRQVELDSLRSADFVAAIRESGVRLVSFREL
ncbi:MAG: ChbG/HpnK family deacetylase [Thermoleophilia bacterium]|nr:ChbG/HpnK family deacetylase [Thermoleophilia bacterium]